MNLTVEPRVEQIPRARRFVVSAVVELGGPSEPSFLDDLALIASEAITNAVEHAGTPVRVTVERRSSGIRVTVHDASPSHIPPAQERRCAGTTGRGLAIIDALASRWGVDQEAGDGKDLWFEVEPAE